MAATPMQRALHPFSHHVDELYNPPTDPEGYPVFNDLDERDEYIRNLLLVSYQNEMEAEVQEEIEGEPVTSWLSDQVTEWARQNNFSGNYYSISELARQITGLDDHAGQQHGSNQPGNGRQRFPINPTHEHSNPTLRFPSPRSRGRSRERSRSPSRRSSSLERIRNSPESSRDHSRSRLSSRERSRSPVRGASSWSNSGPESSPEESESSSDSAQSTLTDSSIDSNSLLRSGSPRTPLESYLPRSRRARSPSDSPEGSPREHRLMRNRDAAPNEEVERQTTQKAYRLMLRREIQKRMQPFEDAFYIAFVGDQAHPPVDGFKPCRGDLIISHQDGRHIGLPNSVGYIGSFPGHYNFTPRDLVLRVGSLETMAASGAFQGNAYFEPFTSLQLHSYHPTRFSSWKFLGHQAKLQNGYDFRNPPDVSPGKFLRVGAPVLGPSSNFVEPLVPRRGDIIIKREAWVEDFSHAWNFWYSMVKWHKGRQFTFFLGDMLVRLLVDNDARNQKWGWAELYKYEGTSIGWIFWGRTKHVYDTPWPKGTKRHIVLYEYDDGAISDDEIQKERVDPRLDPL